MQKEKKEEVFLSWLRRYGGIVVKVARAFTSSLEDCQDLAQEILLQVWLSMAHFQGRASVATWIYRVGLNTALGWQRQESRRRTRQQAVFDWECLKVIGLENSPQEVQNEPVERLYSAIRQLPKTEAALVLLYLEELSYQQMGEVLGISANTVGVKLNRAKKALAELLRELENDSGPF